MMYEECFFEAIVFKYMCIMTLTFHLHHHGPLVLSDVTFVYITTNPESLIISFSSLLKEISYA